MVRSKADMYVPFVDLKIECVLPLEYNPALKMYGLSNKHLNAIQIVWKIVALTGVASQKIDVKNRTTRESSKDIKDMSKKGDKS